MKRIMTFRDDEFNPSTFNWTDERYQTEMLEVLKRVAPRGLSKGALTCYCENLREIEFLQALNTLLVEGKLDARYNSDDNEAEYSLIPE